MPKPTTRDEHVARLHELCRAELDRHQTEYTDEDRSKVEAANAEALEGARLIAADVLGSEAASTLEWEAKGGWAFAELGRGMRLQFQRYPEFISAEGPAGFLEFHVGCPACDNGRTRMVESLADLARDLKAYGPIADWKPDRPRAVHDDRIDVGDVVWRRSEHGWWAAGGFRVEYRTPNVRIDGWYLEQTRLYPYGKYLEGALTERDALELATALVTRDAPAYEAEATS